MNEEIIKTPPHNSEAEDKVIASCLLPGDTSVYDSVASIVSQDDFYTLRGRLLFGAITKLVSEDKPLDEISLQEALKPSGGLDEIGGVSGLLAIMDGATTELQAVFYAKLIAEKAKLRGIIKECRIAVEDAESEGKEYADIRSTLEGGILGIDSKDVDECGIADSIDEIISDVDKMHSGEFVPDVINTNIGRLDSMLGSGGIAAGEVLTLAAPTSCGKSALSLYIATKAMKENSTPTAYFSFEMPRKQLMKRMIQSMSGVNLRSIEERTVSEEQEKRFRECSEQAKDLPLYTCHSVKGADDLVSQCRYFVRKRGVKLIVIDYLQLVPFASGKVSKAEGIANISHRIKQMAIDLNVAVILLAQINREGAKRDGALSLYDLKDSGDIENDADVVLLMWPSKGDVESSKKSDHRGTYTELLYKLAKNREGERDIGCFFKFYHCTGRFD
jgi:replicative DNA helicase